MHVRACVWACVVYISLTSMDACRACEQARMCVCARERATDKQEMHVCVRERATDKERAINACHACKKATMCVCV